MQVFEILVVRAHFHSYFIFCIKIMTQHMPFRKAHEIFKSIPLRREQVFSFHRSPEFQYEPWQDWASVAKFSSSKRHVESVNTKKTDNVFYKYLPSCFCKFRNSLNFSFSGINVLKGERYFTHLHFPLFSTSTGGYLSEYSHLIFLAVFSLPMLHQSLTIFL